ncbi:MAG: glycosyltransferase 87 family protein [Terracidiphilus sp.]
MTGEFDPPPVPERSDLADFSIVLVVGLALTLAVFFFAIQVFGNTAGSRSQGGARDFVSYWATGRQLVQHANPYDRGAISALEHAEGLDVRAVLIMRNPPWALPLAYPLGFLGLRVAAILWSLLLLGCLLLSVRIVRQLYGSPANRLHWLALAFTPALICLTMGQTALFALLGLVLFLRWHKTRPLAAGAALWLCALKPHLFLPFAAALAAWILFSRAWKLLAGAASALALSSAIASLIAPRAWLDYIHLMRSPTVENEFIPCLASAIRQWIDPGATWLQYLPAALSCVWALIYFWRRRATWDWKTHGSLLMLVSLVAAPYCWLYDQCLAIPALLEGAYSTRSRNLLALLALAILVMDIEICIVRVLSPLYLWTAPAWLAWYLLARFGRPGSNLPQAATGSCSPATHT